MNNNYFNRHSNCHMNNYYTTNYNMCNSSLRDYGPNPFVINIESATKENTTFRTALWTGKHLQLTLMCIPVGECIGLEIHPDTDQFLRLEQGEGLVQMGSSKNNLNFEKEYAKIQLYSYQLEHGIT